MDLLGYGLAAFKKEISETESKWTRQNIMTDNVDTSPTGLAVSQMQSLQLVDIDSDGQLDILTGHRFWAETGSRGEYDPSMLVWFKPTKTEKGIHFVPNIVDENSGAGKQIVARDVNGDGRVDILSVSKRGIYLFTQTDSPSEKPKRHSPRDQPGAVADHVIKINDSLGGYRPAWSDTEPMNLDFETGDLTDWNSTGTAFFKQPFAKGKIPQIRKPELSNGIIGDYFVGGYEIVEDQGVGTLTCLPFRLKHRWISYLLSGGSKEIRAEILDPVSQKVLHFSSGNQSEKLERVVVDAKEWLAKTIAVRLIDGSREGWGHINFDDFRVHETKPAGKIRLATDPVPVPPLSSGGNTKVSGHVSNSSSPSGLSTDEVTVWTLMTAKNAAISLSNPIESSKHISHIKVRSSLEMEDMRRLSALKHLKGLDIAHLRFSKETLSLANSLSQLEHLNVWNTAVNDDALATLANLKELRFLNLGLSKATLKGLKFFPLAKLEHLYLNGLAWVDDGLAPLADCRKLHTLSLNSVKLHDQDLRHLSKLTSLVSLDLAQTGCSDQGLKELFELKNLKMLDLNGTKVTHAGRDLIKKNLPVCDIRWR